MRRTGLLIAAIALMVVGLLGIAVLDIIGGPTGPLSAYASNGQRIYLTGSDARGPIPRRVPNAGAGYGMMGYGMMGDVGCVTCHGSDGRGGRISMMTWVIEVPDIRYSTLSKDHTEDGKRIAGWTDDEIATAIRDGTEPNGDSLEPPMPRWRMSEQDVTDVIGYLKELK